MSQSKTPAPVAKTETTPRSSQQEISAFLKSARTLAPAPGGAGRVILALDATMSRQPTWDLACRLQSEMFDAVGARSGLTVQLVYFRGLGECRASRFVRDTGELKSLMTGIACQGGTTQIGKVLSHAIKEHEREKVSAVVYIGDAMEEEVDRLCDKAGTLGLRGLPLFMFQENDDPVARDAFKELARLSRGAWFRFDRNSAATLAKLLSTIAVYATGGHAALEARGTAEDRLLLENLRGGKR